MSHPNFFDAVPKISMYDPLAEFLGATDDGVMRYGYLDAVKLAGHSCPTVACAYWSTYRALAFLYPDALPMRGDIRVEFGQDETSGVTGVIANVVSMLTGAMSGNGFKGIGGRFDRRNKLFFSVAGMQAEIRYTRLDTQQSVKVTSTPQSVASPPRLSELMSVCLSDSATPDERKAFRKLWQDRVRCILLEHGDDPAVFALAPA